MKLPLTDFPGISSRMELRLNRRGITTTEKMYQASIEQLHSVWNSVLGDRWWHPLASITRNSIIENKVDLHS